MKSRTLVSLFFVLLSLTGEAQNSLSTIVLPNGRRTFCEMLPIIGRQLKVYVVYEPDCPELADICLAHGRLTFEKFFEPLKTKGLSFSFEADDRGAAVFLVIKHAEPATPLHPVQRTFVAWTRDESGAPLPGVTVRNINTGVTMATNDSGMVRFGYTAFPVRLFLTHVGRRPIPATIPKDSTVLVLPIDPQSIDEVMVVYGKTKRRNSSDAFGGIPDAASGYSCCPSPRRLSDIATATVQSMLEGLVPGVLTTTSSGIPGSTSYMTVRGQTSILNGSDPLYIIDGVPAAGGNASVSRIQSGNAARSLSSWSFIAPSDIERIDVLKDADATAIYGSRGANGVILITTQHWRADLPKWDVEFTTGFSAVNRLPSFMNIRQYVAMRREGLNNSGLPVDSTNAPDLALLDTSRSYNWEKWLLGRSAPLENIKLAFSGGDRGDNYTIGMNYLKESTPFPTQPDHDRLTLNFNYDHVSNDRRWTLQVAGLSGRDANHQFIATDPTKFQTLAPNAPAPLDRFGYLNYPSGLPYVNPLGVIRDPYDAISSSYHFSVVTNYQISANLSCQTTLGFNHLQIRESGQMPLSSQDPMNFPVATGYFANTSLDSRIFEPRIVYKRKVGKVLANWLCGASFQGADDHSTARKDTGYSNAIPVDTASHRIGGFYTAYFTSLNANWNDRYIFSLTDRIDGSRRFPAGHRLANFGSASFAWIFSGGKLKISEGVTGNNQMGDRTLQTVAGTYIPSFRNFASLYPANPAGTGWEKTYKTELSLDLGFLKDRILFNATGYLHRSDNLLESSWPVVLQNWGYEFSLSAQLVNHDRFGWDLAANWTVPRSKLASFPDLSSSPYANQLIVGKSINVLRGYVSTGVDKQTGLFTFADIDHDGAITDADQKAVGKFDVTGFGGLENTLRFGHFQFQVLLDTRFATGINYLAAVYANNPPGSIQDGVNSNVPKAMLDYWRQPGDKASYQKVYAVPTGAADTALTRYISSSALLANASFLRLRKVSIVYDLPQLRALAMHLTSLEIFADGQNLFVIGPYKADAEIQSIATMPAMRTLEAGIRVAF